MTGDHGILLLGRHAELDRILQRFDRRAPAFVLLTGETGAGKSSLLRAAATEAQNRGWRAIGLEDGGSGLTVDPSTSEHLFVERVLELVREPAAVWHRTPDVEAHVAVAAREPWRSEVLGLARELGEHAPLVVVIDGFRPSEDFTAAFVRLAGRVRQGRSSIVLLVGARPVEAELISRAADEVIELGALDEEPVRRYFEELVLEPKLTRAEIDTYVEHAVQRPDSAVALARVLTLAEARTQPP
jgi:energy-coupling factor transporter ATP-binding protein EcfA2